MFENSLLDVTYLRLNYMQLYKNKVKLSAP